MTLSDYEGHWYKQTLLQRLLQKQVHREEVQEEIRILYVALTRAKDILYMTGTVKDGEKFLAARESAMGGDSMYLSMADQASSLEMINANLLSGGQSEEPIYFVNPMSQAIYDGEVSEEEGLRVLRKLDFFYPYEHARSLKSKYSVTEINRKAELLESSFVEELAVPKFRQGEKKLTAAERGTVYHGIMERIDFAAAAREGIDYLKTAVAEMIEQEIFTAEEIAAVRLSRITDFFESELGKRCAKAFAAGSLQRERPFNLQMEMDGENVIVQGIIDCSFEEEDGLVLFDYKTNWIDREKPFEQEADRLRQMYRQQIAIYCRALAKTYGKPVKEAYLYLFGAGCGIEMKLEGKYE